MLRNILVRQARIRQDISERCAFINNPHGFPWGFLAFFLFVFADQNLSDLMHRASNASDGVFSYVERAVGGICANTQVRTLSQQDRNALYLEQDTSDRRDTLLQGEL